MLMLRAVAFVVGVASHGLVFRLARGRGFRRSALVSIASSLVTAWCIQIFNYTDRREFPEPPGPVLIIAIVTLPASAASGLLIRWYVDPVRRPERFDERRSE